MQTKKVIVNTPHGMHMRFAGEIMEKARNCASRVTLRKGDESANGRSIIELLMLDASEGSELELLVDGSDEEVVVAELERIFLMGPARGG
jgi:phosphotransferase system HPr (HPr) family protein